MFNIWLLGHSNFQLFNVNSIGFIDSIDCKKVFEWLFKNFKYFFRPSMSLNAYIACQTLKRLSDVLKPFKDLLKSLRAFKKSFFQAFIKDFPKPMGKNQRKSFCHWPTLKSWILKTLLLLIGNFFCHRDTKLSMSNHSILSNCFIS